MDFEGKIIYAVVAVLTLVPIILCVVATYFLVTNESRNSTPIKKAIDNCERYKKEACHLISPNLTPSKVPIPIIQGDDVPLGLFPHMAHLEIKSGTVPVVTAVCGGSLISEYFILSAAHCVNEFRDNAKIKVKLGGVNVYDGTMQEFAVKKFHIHPQYNHEKSLHDMLLLELAEKVKFDSIIRPICLNTNYQPDNYNKMTVSGWGRTENASISERLKMVQIYTDGEIKTKCRKPLDEGAFDPNLVICGAGLPQTSKSPHQGDSGGPLQVPLSTLCPNKYIYELIGVASSVEERNLKLGDTILSLYTKVEPYIPWIANIVWS